MEGRPEFVAKGEQARLIPLGGSKENNATSVLLACMMAIDEFAAALMAAVDVNVGKRWKMQNLTEVVLSDRGQMRDTRPDGLIAVNTGKTTRYYLVEAKVGNNALATDQIEQYLDLARDFRLDGLITVSNQFTPSRSHHPVEVNKTKLRSVSLHHWSWLSLLAEAQILAKNKLVSDPDQAYILNEFMRYMEHENSGVMAFDEMSPSWTEACDLIHSSDGVGLDEEKANQVVADWLQLARFLCIMQSRELGRHVTLRIPKVARHDHNALLALHRRTLQDEKKLYAEIVVPDAADDITICADFRARSVSFRMRLKAPEDKQQVKSRVNWLRTQLAKCTDTEILIHATWPGKTPPTREKLGQLLEPGSKIDAGTGSLPTAFEIVRVVDFGLDFKRRRKFVEAMVGPRGRATETTTARSALHAFYSDVGQHLRAWVPPAPKVAAAAGAAGSDPQNGGSTAGPDEVVLEIDPSD